MRPDYFFDVPPPRRKMTADERLDYLDSLTSPQGRVILQLDENRGWSLKETVLLEGRLGVRHAIDDFALEHGYHPPPIRLPPPDSSAVIRGGRSSVQATIVLSLCLALAGVLALYSCPDPAPDLRETRVMTLRGVELAAPPPNRGSGEPNAERRTAPASREQPSGFVVVPGRLGPAKLDGPVLFSEVR